MHVYYLICPNSAFLNSNPGVALIAYGCRYLIKQADPSSYFVPVSNINHSAQAWELLLHDADCLVLPGGSLYDPSNVSVYWNDTIWQHIKTAQDRGIPFADLWGYSSYSFPPLSLKQASLDILKQPRTHRILAQQKKAALFVPRDVLTSLIARSAGINSPPLPCCAFWSPDFFGIKPSSRLYNCISVFPIVKDVWFARALMRISQELDEEKPTYLICNTYPEYQWLSSFYPHADNILCIYDPISLLDFYSHVDKMVSARLHAAIPALALGSQVCYLSFDSRSFALDLFGITPFPYLDLRDESVPLNYSTVSAINPPDPAPFIDLFRSKVVSRL